MLCKKAFVSVLVSFLLAPAAAMAQTASVSGRVVDAQTLPIAGATVTARAATGASTVATTNSDGRYELGGLATGAYVLHVEQPGFVAIEVPIRVTACWCCRRSPLRIAGISANGG
jgi:hypothetical protein